MSKDDWKQAKKRPAPSVGRIVHFFTDNPKEQRNGAGRGPYAALVTQVFANDLCNLKVFPPMGPEYDVGSIPPEATDEAHRGRFWSWPKMITADWNAAEAKDDKAD
jgi:hypothetical protein